MRQVEARARREGRAAARIQPPPPPPAASGRASIPARADRDSEQERLESMFRLELIDECPRCGESMAVDASGSSDDGDPSSGAGSSSRRPKVHAEHLAGCTNKAAHRLHAAAVAARASAALVASSKADAAAEASALAQVSFAYAEGERSVRRFMIICSNLYHVASVGGWRLRRRQALGVASAGARNPLPWGRAL